MASEDTFAAKQRISDIEDEPCKMLLPIEGYEEVPLLPINLTVEPLEHIIPNIGRNAWIAKEGTDETPPDGLTQDESASIHLYTMEWKPTSHSLYLCLNAALRAQDRDLLVPYFRYLKLILSGLWKLQSVRKTVWRGVKADVNAKYVVGKTFVWWGFSSCTESLTLLESEKFLGKSGTRTLFNIECESGKEIRHHSYFQQENEILVLPGTRFEVVGKINPAPGLHIIHVREIKPPFPLLQPPFVQAHASPKPTNLNASHQSKPESTIITNLSSSAAVTTEHQVPNPKTYLNEKLAALIQQKAELLFAEFREQQLTDEDAQLIANELATNTCWTGLNLPDNNIGLAGMKSLSNAIQLNIKLTILQLENNQLVDDSITSLAFALRVNQNLQDLQLDKNRISDNGAKQLAEMLKINISLRRLRLKNNAIADSGMIALALALGQNTSLRYLDLESNRITDKSVDAIKKALLQNETLHFFRVGFNKFSAEGYAELVKIGKQSKVSVYVD